MLFEHTLKIGQSRRRQTLFFLLLLTHVSKWKNESSTNALIYLQLSSKGNRPYMMIVGLTSFSVMFCFLIEDIIVRESNLSFPFLFSRIVYWMTVKKSERRQVVKSSILIEFYSRFSMIISRHYLNELSSSFESNDDDENLIISTS